MKHYLSLLYLLYLRFFAKLQLAKNPRAVIVGITGSSGKSSAVSSIALALSTRGVVKQTLGGNSESGIPLDILGLHTSTYSYLDWLRLAVLAPLKVLFSWPHYDFYVVEMGIDSPNSPKNMSYLLSIIRPSIGVFLNAGLVHGANFDHLVQDRSPERRAKKIVLEIAKEKTKLLEILPPTGLAVYNYDQKEISNLVSAVVARRLSFGRHKGASVQTSSTLTRRGFSIRAKYLHHEVNLLLPEYLERGYEGTFGATLALSYGLSLPVEQVLEKLKTYRPPPGRLRTFAGTRELTLLDSSYNASPATMYNCLSLLGEVAKGRHKVAVIGDMRELGAGSKKAHKELADWLTRFTDEAILFGPQTLAHTLPVLESRRFPVHHFDKMAELNAYTKEQLPKGSLVLIKGSQNTILLERAVEALLANHSDATSLCRRGSYWDKVRRATP